jgi:hypothetical protein
VICHGLIQPLRKPLTNAKLYRKLAKYPNEDNLVNFRQSINEVRNLVNTSETNNRNRLCESLNDYSSGSKHYWHILKQLLGKKFNNGVPTLQIDNIAIDCDREKSNNFLSKLASKFHHDWDVSEIPAFDNQTKAVIEVIRITPERVRKIISNLDVSKQGGKGGLSNKMLKLVATSLDTPLCRLFNILMESGHFPTCWKFGIVIPIYKNKGSKNCIDNHRPVTLLNSLSKLFERVVYEDIHYHLQVNNLLYECQYGFLSGHDTQKQWTDSVHNLLLNIESRNITRGIFLDISGAFDGVQHFLLMKKLSCYGIRGKVSDLLQTYLKDRFIKARVNNSFSDTK